MEENTWNIKISKTDIYYSPHAETYLLSKENIVVIEAKSFCPSKLLKEMLEAILPLAQQHQVKRWFLDLKQFSAGPADISWVVDEYIPRLVATNGSNHFIAFIPPENIIFQFGVKQRLDQHFPNGSLRVFAMPDREHSLIWLKECDF